MAIARYKKNVINLSTQTIAVYASPRLSAALASVTAGMNFYQGVKLVEVLEAVYGQGHKDGARKAFEAHTLKAREAERLVAHRNPGQPKKKR